MRVAEQELTSEEVIERFQGTGNNLEKRLRKVKDLEGRLEEVDGMAERLQKVIEEELGNEEVERLREEVEREERIQVEGVTKRVVKKSVRGIETEEDEMDELEEQIKQVFLKGLLPEEVEVKQDSENEVINESLLDDSLREKLRQIEMEWQDKLGERFRSSDDADTTSVVTYQKVESRTKKRVTIVDERGQRQEDIEDMQVHPGVTSEERLEKREIWSKTELLEGRTERELTERLREPFKKVEDKDAWFILFDRPPYKAVFKPPGTVCHCANSFKAPLISLI